MVDGSGLENRQSESSRGFESHPLRHINFFGKPSSVVCSGGSRTSGDSNKVRLVGRLSRKGSKRSSNSRAKAQLWIIPPPPPYLREMAVPAVFDRRIVWLDRVSPHRLLERRS